MPLEDLVTDGADEVGLQAAAGLTGELVVRLRGGQQFVLELSLAVFGVEGVAAEPGDTGAVGHGALFDQSNATLLGSSERVAGVAGTHYGILRRPIPCYSRPFFKRLLNAITSTVRT